MVLDSNKQAVEDMLFYYLYALIRSGVEDPKQVIATELPKMIGLSEAQLDYVKINTVESNKLIENLDCSIELLENMTKTKKLDLESINIVIGILKAMKVDAKKPLEDFFGSNEDDTTGQQSE